MARMIDVRWQNSDTMINSTKLSACKWLKTIIQVIKVYARLFKICWDPEFPSCGYMDILCTFTRWCLQIGCFLQSTIQPPPRSLDYHLRRQWQNSNNSHRVLFHLAGRSGSTTYHKSVTVLSCNICHISCITNYDIQMKYSLSILMGDGFLAALTAVRNRA